MTVCANPSSQHVGQPRSATSATGRAANPSHGCDDAMRPEAAANAESPITPRTKCSAMLLLENISSFLSTSDAVVRASRTHYLSCHGHEAKSIAMPRAEADRIVIADATDRVRCQREALLAPRSRSRLDRTGRFAEQRVGGAGAGERSEEHVDAREAEYCQPRRQRQWRHDAARKQPRRRQTPDQSFTVADIFSHHSYLS